MVQETLKGKNKFFICEACGFAYKSKEHAKECEEWCNQHQSCNLEITKFATKI